MTRAKPRTTCTYHCRSCSRHFHSLEAFDAHRIGDYASNDPETRRRCEGPAGIVDKEGKPRFVVLNEHGICDVTEVYYDDVAVWTLRFDQGEARDHWAEATRARQALAADVSEHVPGEVA